MIRKNNPLDVYLIRHAEAYKNLAKIHGGGEQRLTPAGENQARILGNHLLKLSGLPEKLRVVHQPEGRAEATARRIGMIAGVSIVKVTELEGVSLGVAGGLTEHELTQLYPEVAAALTAWRNKKGDLSARPRVPGSEPMEEFAERVSLGLSSSIEACEPESNLAIVATTSTLNMINHLLLYDGRFDRTVYDFIEFPLGSFACWKISSKPPVQIKTITTPRE